MQRRLLLTTALAACGPTTSPPNAPAPVPAKVAPAAPVAATIAIVDVTVVPMDSDRELAHQTVLIDREKIVAIGPAASTAVAPGAQRIDGRGKWLVPGLIDMHVHFNDERDGLLFVANGVTTVRNMWGNPQQLAWREKARTNAADWMGPSIVTAGPIVDGDPPTWPGSRVVKTADEAVAEVAAEQQAGYDFIKVYDGLPLAAYDALAAAAKRANMRFVGHVPAAAGLAHALAVGQGSIEHLTGYTLAAQDERSKAASMPRGAEQRAEIAAHLDERKIPGLAKATRDAGAANVPTLVVLARFAALDHPEPLLARPENKYVSPVTLASWDPKQDFRLKSMTAEAFAGMRTGNVFRAKLVKALADAGAPVFAGTDTPNPFVVPGFALHEELALFVAAGMTPYQALRAATAAPAAWLGLRDGGTVAVGSRADLVLLDRDPRRDIAATTHRAGVVLRGRWFAQRELDGKLEELAASYTKTVDRFANVAPLALGEATPVFTATYRTTYAGAEVGKERLAIGRTKAGHRVIVAQGAGDPPLPKLTVVRVEFDARGKLVAFEIDADGKHATATRAGAALHIAAGQGARDEKLPDDTLLDANLMATMQPFIDRAVDGKKVEVTGKGFSADGSLSVGGYTFDRKGKELDFVARAPWGNVPGHCKLDGDGRAITCALRAGPSTLQIERE